MFGKYNTSQFCITLAVFLLSVKSIINETLESDYDKDLFIENSREKNLKSFSTLGKVKLCETYDSERADLIQNYITKNSKKLSEEDIKLIKFIAGDCLPIIIFPGFYANKFQLQITNCTAINLYHPEIAIACGYDHKCRNGHEEMFWLSENFETDDGRTCLGELAKFNLKRNETEADPKKKFYEEVFKGFRLTYWGNTPLTENRNECGFGASSNLLDKPFYFGKKSPRGMLGIKKHFLNLGYTLGVNLFSIPFDWRRNANHEYNFQLAKQTVDLAYRLTGKRSVLLGHSYGSIVALSYLYTISKEEKEKKISRLIGLGPPFTGANKSIKGFITGFEEMNIQIKILSFSIIDIYYSIQNQKILLYNNPAPLEMFPRFFWNNHKDDEWMNVARNRAKAENKITQCVRNYFKDKYGENPIQNSFWDFNKYLKDFSDNVEVLNDGNFNVFLEAGEEFDDQLNNHEVFKYKILNSKNIKVSTSQNEDKEIKEKCIENTITESSEDLKKFKELFPFFPDLQQGCGIQKLNDATCLKLPYCRSSIWDQYCRLNFFTPLDNPMVEIKDGEETFSYDLLTKENIIEMIKKYGMATPDLEYLEYVFENFSNDLQELNHPGVPVTTYYADLTMTAQSFLIPDNPKKYTDQDKLVIDVLGGQIVQFGGGDGTISTANVVMPPFKWSLDKEQIEKNPIHLVSYCSNQDFTSSEIKFDKNQYMNLNCGCSHPGSDSCSHSSFVSDPDIMDHITQYTMNTRNRMDVREFCENFDLVSKGINHVENELICSNLKTVNEMFIFYE